MNKASTTKTLREVLAENGDLRRKAQSAAIIAAYNVIKEAGYSITAKDIDEMKADNTAIAIALDSSLEAKPKGDNTAEVIIAAGIGAAIAAGGF